MNTAEKNTVAIIEDNPEVQGILCEYINNSESYSLYGSFGNCKEALLNFSKTPPRIVLMDIDLPEINGIEGTKRIKQLNSKIDVIIITVFENSENVFSALCAGASGYLTKNIKQDELLASIEECMNGGAPMSMKIAKMVVGSFMKNTKSPLTERETKVLSLLSQGKSYNTIASLLFVSKDTIKYHIKNIYSKLQVDNKEAAIDIANKEKFI